MTRNRTLALSTLPLACVMNLAAQDAPAKPTFDPLVELTAGGAPITEMMYPSPTLYDIDGDGARELVIGDIFGHVRIAKPGASATEWSALSKLHTDDEILKLNNW